MIIGITGNNKLGKNAISSFLGENYSFKYFDVDQILEEVLKRECYKEGLKRQDWRKDTSLLLRIKNDIDVEIKSYTDGLEESEVAVIDYSLLEDSFITDKCDLVIRCHGNSQIELDTDMDTLRPHRINSVATKYNNSEYHLELNMQENWQEQLKTFIDYNLYNDKKVTVVVPIYNTANYLSRCVNSITNQTYRNLEILLIDDGSTDESLRICHLLAENDKRIKVIHQENMGLSETRNRGIELATGEYICFFDSDDFIENSMIENLLRNAERTNADVSEGSFFIRMLNGEVKDTSAPDKGIKFIGDRKQLVDSYADSVILIPAWDKLYKLSAIKDVKFDKTCFKEDSDYILKLCLLGKTFVLDTNVYYHYVKRGNGSLTGNKF